LGSGRKRKGFGSGSAGSGKFGLAGEFRQFCDSGQAARGEKSGISRQGQFPTKSGIVHEKNGFIFPTGRI
jgi:hypothetical protein